MPSLTPASRMAGEVGVVEVALAEMDVVAALLDREPPVVVDDQLGAGGSAEIARAADLRAQLGLGAILDPELRQADAVRQQALQPGSRRRR